MDIPPIKSKMQNSSRPVMCASVSAAASQGTATSGLDFLDTRVGDDGLQDPVSRLHSKGSVIEPYAIDTARCDKLNSRANTILRTIGNAIESRSKD